MAGEVKASPLSVSLVGSRSTSESELTPSPKDAKKGGVNGQGKQQLVVTASEWQQHAR